MKITETRLSLQKHINNYVLCTFKTDVQNNLDNKSYYLGTKFKTLLYLQKNTMKITKTRLSLQKHINNYVLRTFKTCAKQLGLQKLLARY